MDADKRIIAQIVDVNTGEVFEFHSLAESFENSRKMKKDKVPHTIEAKDKKDNWVMIETWTPME